MVNDAEEQKPTPTDLARIKAEYEHFKKDMAIAEESRSDLNKMAGKVHKLEDILATPNPLAGLSTGVVGIAGMKPVSDEMIGIKPMSELMGFNSISKMLGLGMQSHLTTALSGISTAFTPALGLAELTKTLNKNAFAGLTAQSALAGTFANTLKIAAPAYESPFKDLYAANPGFASVFKTLSDGGWVKQTGLVNGVAEQLARLRSESMSFENQLAQLGTEAMSTVPDILTDEFVDSVLEQEEELLEAVDEDYEERAQEIAEQNPELAEAVAAVAARLNLTPTQQVCLYLSVGALFAFFTYIGVLMLEDSSPVVEGLMEAGKASASEIATGVGGGATLIAKTATDPYVERPAKDQSDE